ncbi:hypothetical protein EFU53_003825 [Vibrio cholerae]|uniref:hypothetical protein n=1 Tax=Vibrio TaxID=662 RepID=UPI0004961DA5|nr:MULTISPECIES: hypothetical protein [Vibrio]MBW5444363.1 hypothetical protein [Vibrio cholerae]MCO7021579.1 hypothetical protein [Vibrio paracholerae]MCO7025153.1 hypothetical protein [Vibrio paracholerae]MCX9480280.1 hypothetical protein [Vibrio cholerae]MDA5311890.1 hypothetical protein [Vibrio cholerae]
MEIVSKSIVLQLSKKSGMAVLELENCTLWAMIDVPHQNVVGSKAQILKKGRSYYIQFEGSNEKFAADEM